MSDLEEFYGPNAGYVLDLYERYQQNPDGVDPATRAVFQKWTPPADTPKQKNGVHPAPPAAPAPAATPPAPQVDVMKVVGAARVTRLVRELGHLTAHIDPLGSEPPGDPNLELASHGLIEEDMKALPAGVVGGPVAENAKNALEALNRLRRAYSGSIGYEDDHIQNPTERDWIRHAVETRRFFQDFGIEEQAQGADAADGSGDAGAVSASDVCGRETFLH